MRLDVIFRVGAKIMLPFILIFAFYVQFHADFGPGGGFQAGVISTAMVILYTIIFGLDAARKVVPPWIPELMIPLGILIFAGTGMVDLLLGGNFLDYSVMGPDAPHGQEYGIMIVEIGVLVTVFGAMTSIFYAIVGRAR
jgi:multicomponent Na+:H+ antiporter subunit B